MALWKVTGTRNGKPKTVTLAASSYNEAVRRASHAGFMLCVTEAQLIETPEQQREARERCAAIVLYGMTAPLEILYPDYKA